MWSSARNLKKRKNEPSGCGSRRSQTALPPTAGAESRQGAALLYLADRIRRRRLAVDPSRADLDLLRPHRLHGDGDRDVHARVHAWDDVPPEVDEHRVRDVRD